MYDRIWTLAKAKGLSIPALEELAGVSQSTIGKWKKVKPKPKTPKTDTKKLNRLNELYIEGIITREEFNARREKLITPPTPTPDLSIAKTIALSENIRESYYSLSRQERRMLWRNIVKSIEAKGDSVTVAFVGSN